MVEEPVTMRATRKPLFLADLPDQLPMQVHTNRAETVQSMDMDIRARKACKHCRGKIVQSLVESQAGSRHSCSGDAAGHKYHKRTMNRVAPYDYTVEIVLKDSEEAGDAAGMVMIWMRKSSRSCRTESDVISGHG